MDVFTLVKPINIRPSNNFFVILDLVIKLQVSCCTSCFWHKHRQRRSKWPVVRSLAATVELIQLVMAKWIAQPTSLLYWRIIFFNATRYHVDMAFWFTLLHIIVMFWRLKFAGARYDCFTKIFLYEVLLRICYYNFVLAIALFKTRFKRNVYAVIYQKQAAYR